MKVDQLSIFLLDKYNLEGELIIIYSELDAVYKLKNEAGTFTIKASMPGKDVRLIEMEHAASIHLKQNNGEARGSMGSSLPHKNNFQISTPVKSVNGKEFEYYDNQIIRVFPWIDLPLQATVRPLTDLSYQSIGVLAANLTIAFSDFDHSAAHRFIKWDPSAVNWIKEYLYLHEPEWKSTFTKWIEELNQLHLKYNHELRKQVCYADLNDYNVLMQWNEEELAYKAAAIIDLGDMVYTHTINEVAIACFYSCIKTVDPLAIAGQILGSYHTLQPLNEAEIELLYYHIAARMMISLTVAAINKKEHPDNEYLQITDEDAWDLAKKWKATHPSYAHYYFRSACKLEPCIKNEKFISWAKNGRFHSIINHSPDKIKVLDLSIGSEEIGNVPEYENIDIWVDKLNEIKKANKAEVLIGRYLECRPVYTSDSFQYEDNHGPAWRTVHIGLDIFDEAETNIYTPLDGEIMAIADNSGDKDYGPTIIIKHMADDMEFYTLYGHLSSNSLSIHSQGEKIKSGDLIGHIGDYPQNGNWPPHLHFQIILDLFDFIHDYPGVCHYDLKNLYSSICPDPNLILRLPLAEKVDTANDLLKRRQESIGKNVSISYKKPLIILRAYRQFLYDYTGRRYLDTVNNVAHCGHQHPAIIRAAEKQMRLLNTNTRYLYPQLVDFAEKLKSFLHPSLSTVYFVNSGSEANELAIRMVKTYSGSQHMLVYEHGYHGNTSNLIDLSSYKFDRKGGKGAPPTTHKLTMPDVYRGKYGNNENQYLIEAKSSIDQLIDSNQKPAALLAEYILSCGGQVVCPTNYFKKLIQYLQSKDILYIADEVQTGIGRTGKFCSYEYADVVPDIVTFGKPLGNGHPLGAVVCNQKVADVFNNGMEYFNTFGGNPVSCVIGNTVLDIVQNENYMDHALKIQDAFYKGFESLKQEFQILSDYRGLGLFLGIEFSVDKTGKKPATNQAKYLVHRMKEFGILMSTDGPDDNVIKIKPPMVFDVMNTEEVLSKMNKVLREDYIF